MQKLRHVTPISKKKIPQRKPKSWQYLIEKPKNNFFSWGKKNFPKISLEVHNLKLKKKKSSPAISGSMENKTQN